MSRQASRHKIKKSLRTNFDPGFGWYKSRAKLRALQASHFPGLMRGGKLDRPVFVIGAPRSGTMLLYSVLREHPRFEHWRPTEAHEVWEADYHPMLRGWSSNVLTAADVQPAAAARIKRSFFLVTGAKKRLIDKTPRNVMRVPFIDAIFPDARYVFLKRDGRENINSLINAWRSKRYRTYELPEPHSIPGVDPRWWKFVLYPNWRDDKQLEVVCANQWIASNSYALSALEAIDPNRWTHVRYEDLITRPEREVERLLKFCDLDYDPTVRARAAAVKTTPINVVTPPEPGKWRRENPNEIAAIEQLIAPTMKRLGYSL
jgi:Sulfotransferase family